MALSDMQVFNQYAYLSATETITQQVELFNQATNGALVLQAASNQGDFSFEAMFKQISGLVVNRNAYGSGSLTPVDLEQLQNASVKVGGQTKVVRFEPQQFDWIQRNQEEAGTAYGEQVAAGMMQYYLNTAIGSLVAAFTGQAAAVVTDESANGTASLGYLNKGASKFGDRAGNLAAWIMHSKSLHDIYGNALANSERLFQFGNVQVVSDGFGRPLIMTDSAHLVDSTKYRQLGLVAGACMVEDNGDMRTYDDVKIDQENVQHTMKSEFSFNVGLKGYTWDTTNGGKSPNDAALATSTNWDKTSTDIKDTAGVMVITQ